MSMIPELLSVESRPTLTFWASLLQARPVPGRKTLHGSATNAAASNAPGNRHGNADRPQLLATVQIKW